MSGEEAEPTGEPKPDIAPLNSDVGKGEHRPFYKKIEFYLSLTALLLSGISLYFSFLNSPLSSFVRPRIEYESTTTLVTMKEESAGMILMIGIIHNKSDAPAEGVLATILTEGKPDSKFTYTGLNTI